MNRMIVCAGLAATLVLGCDGPDPWSGEPDVYESDDAISDAKEFRLHASACPRTFSPAGDVDYIRFRVEEVDTDTTDEYFTFAYWAMYGASYLEVSVYSDQGYIDTSTTPITMPGVYYLCVSEGSDNEGDYESWVTFWRHVPETDTTPTGIHSPDLVVGEVVGPQTAAFGSDHALTVRLANQDGTAGNTSFAVTAYLSDGPNLVGGELAIGTTTGLTLDGWSCDDATIDITLPGTFTTVPAYIIVKVDSQNDVIEYNENNNTAFTSLLLGDLDTYVEPTGTQDRLTYPEEDEDVFDIVVATPGWYEVWTHDLRAGSDTFLRILDDTETELAADDDGGLENHSSYIAVELTAGTYTARVTDSQEGIGAFDISWRACDADPHDYDASWLWNLEPDDYDVSVEKFNVFSQGMGPWRATLTPSGPVSRTLHATDDVDWIVYGVEHTDPLKTHRIYTNIPGVSTCIPDIELFDARGMSIGVGTPIGATDEQEIELPDFASGLYYIRVSNGSSSVAPGDYEVHADTPY